jgi:hypothetical protein
VELDSHAAEKSEVIANVPGDASHSVNNVVDKKRILGKKEGQRGGKASLAKKALSVNYDQN